MTQPSVQRRRIDRSARRQVFGLLIGLALVWLVTLILMLRGSMIAGPPPRYLAQLRRLQSANPEADAAAAFEGGNLKFYVLDRSDGQKIPGVANVDDRHRYGVRVIPVPFDTPNGAEQERLQHVAFTYAYRYNVELLKRMAGQGSATSGPSATTRPAATRASTTPP